ncbi:dihydrouridine synthase 4 [Arctopsyche grandis]|uniref:dihydrouridine synthase 4 n=1 Tax=Arctopsyche grandis TaxID=121162 RepID=UPI00406D8390
MNTKPKTDINELFATAKKNDTFLKVCAPMVRYSKLQFRSLVKQYGVDLCFSPMILADSFCHSSKARYNEFATSTSDTPLIVQFAAKTTHDFVGASKLIYPYADGVDLNCGCPQRWAMKDGYGCSLLTQPEIIHDLVRNFKNNLPNDISVSVKIRLLNDLKDTIELCRRLEKCGVNFLTVHGRKVWQKSSENADISSLKDVKQSISIPFIANGNVKSNDDAKHVFETTGCDGVMAAQGLLSNPAMFACETSTTLKCIQDWVDICHDQKDSMIFQCFHHHLVFMMDKFLRKKQKQVFNNLTNHSAVYDFLEQHLGIKPNSIDEDVIGEKVICVYDDIEYSLLKKMYGNQEDNALCENNEYNSQQTHGKYFMNTISKTYCDLDNMDCTLFDET